MRKLLLAAVVLYLSNFASAQITLTSSGYPASLLGTDSLKKTVYSSPFPSFASMSGDLCDMTSLVDTNNIFLACRVPTAGYEYSDSSIYSLAGLQYVEKVFCSITGARVAELGINSPYYAHDLSFLTAGATDSLFIPNQTSMFSDSHVKIAFPTTLGSSWYSMWNSDFHFEISYAAYSLFHAPCQAKKYKFENSSVIGWGKMRVNDVYGFPSEYLDVLQVKTVTYTTDSFFLSGSPMPSTLLTALSLVQGKTDTTYAQNFYREQEVTPLANVLFRDAGFTQPYQATTHIQRLQPVGINDLVNESVDVFPNPVRNRTLTMQLPRRVANWSYELINMSGAVVQSGVLKAPHRTEISLNESVSPGVYFLRLSGDKVYSRQLVVTE